MNKNCKGKNANCTNITLVIVKCILYLYNLYVLTRKGK
jgi:hypothetical protein